ncbi:lisH domain-containing protein C1711.05-like [Chiloscyllium plagiosum]|uniref:lisH domain-containing protein C1711.05-like n=1 Tax=Chiloscyllium plagiosum TaxID=36176 RepID=UPI001CB7BB14|nr:lisH domain-containing protein C1711.05-like [Chiloscyllium plagiosum]
MIQSRASAEIMTYDDLFASTSSSQSSYQEYLSSLPSDISTPRSESSSQISLNSEIADDFVNNSECSVISSMPSEALINLMQSYFANSDDVKSVKISILLDKSQTDDLSHTSNVEENANESSCQTNSPSDSEQYSRIGLKGKCGFLHGGNNSTDVEPSFASVENSETCSSSLDSQEFVHFDSQIPSIVGRSSDWYCADDKEPCSKTTTVRYVFTDSENEV